VQEEDLDGHDHGRRPVLPRARPTAAQPGVRLRTDVYPGTPQAAVRPKTTTVKQAQRYIRETYVRYKVVVTRVQVAERFVRATSEEDAAAKVQEEFERPYGYFGSWKTTTSEVDVRRPLKR
jgi:hypothetical protein